VQAGLLSPVRADSGAADSCWLLMKWKKVMYRSISVARESSDDFAIVLKFALLGLALSLLAIGQGIIDLKYMANFLLLF
jgi:hypothetical protein